MSDQDQPEWFYVGHYGQLGPLTFAQLRELMEDGVVVRQTFVWKSGMAQWLAANDLPDLRDLFGIYSPAAPPPLPVTAPPVALPAFMPDYGSLTPVLSDRSRVLAGCLNFLPGAGRLYLGYGALGVLQILVTTVTCGFGYIWPFIDAICILAKVVKVDGFGRRLLESGMMK
jgi:TM2 domain-containing membrane protein YozV